MAEYLGPALKLLATDKGLDMREVAARLSQKAKADGLKGSQSSLYNWLGGRSFPSFDSLAALLETLGCQLEELQKAMLAARLQADERAKERAPFEWALARLEGTATSDPAVRSALLELLESRSDLPLALQEMAASLRHQKVSQGE